MVSLVGSSLQLLYPGHERLPSFAECNMHEFLETYRREAPWHMWFGLVLASLIFQLSPLFTVGVPLWASVLDSDRANRHAHALASSNLYLVRQLVFLLKMAAGLAWGRDARVRAEFGMPPLPPDPTDWRTE